AAVRLRIAPSPLPGTISLTRNVVPSVPLEIHSSRPRVPSFAVKTRAPLERPTSCSGELLELPGRMSATCTVPPGVPSVIHSSTPLPGEVAAKYVRLVVGAGVKKAGFEDADPGFTSSSSDVPPGVPSVTQGSVPSVGRFAMKTVRVAPTGVKPLAPEPD